jgi:hypothetical protein
VRSKVRNCKGHIISSTGELSLHPLIHSPHTKHLLHSMVTRHPFSTPQKSVLPLWSATAQTSCTLPEPVAKAPAAFRLALQLTITISMPVLQHLTWKTSPFADSLNLYLTVLLTFLTPIVRHPAAMDMLKRSIPWEDLGALYCPTHIQLESSGIHDPNSLESHGIHGITMDSSGFHGFHGIPQFQDS